MAHNLRKHGSKPYRLAVVHGGPGANGSVAPVARELCADGGVLEPLQTAKSVDGQVKELRAVLEQHGEPPMILIGHSWGAWLVFILASRYPRMVKKLILISGAPFEARYHKDVLTTRLSRLNQRDRKAAEALREKLKGYPNVSARTLDRYINLLNRGDFYDPLPGTHNPTYQYHLFQDIWVEAEKLRESGKLLEMGKKIRCPVVAIHGSYDPIPYNGVKKPLSRILKNFKFVLLKKCGHVPWHEREAHDRFYAILRSFISDNGKRVTK